MMIKNKKNLHSILYRNIDKVLKDEEWLAFIKKIAIHQNTKSTEIGIMTDARLKKKYLLRKYLFDIGITCGFISLIPNTKKIIEVIFKILDANEAKGRRKYVRAHCLEGDTFNFILDKKIYYGDILDISMVGMACMLHDETLKLVTDMELENIQLKLQGIISMTAGKVFGSREVTEKKLLYVILFDMDTVRPKGGENIINYICKRQDDFIKDNLVSCLDTSIESKEVLNTEDDLQNKPNEQLVQEVNEELQVLGVELKEINKIIKKQEKNI